MKRRVPMQSRADKKDNEKIDRRKTEILHILGIEKRKDAKNPGGEPFNVWTRIGTAFVNSDGSINLRFSYLPLNPEITLQVRKPDEKARAGEQEGADAEAA
jgi:hypothetical protein